MFHFHLCWKHGMCFCFCWHLFPSKKWLILTCFVSWCTFVDGGQQIESELFMFLWDIYLSQIVGGILWNQFGTGSFLSFRSCCPWNMPFGKLQRFHPHEIGSSQIANWNIFFERQRLWIHIWLLGFATWNEGFLGFLLTSARCPMGFMLSQEGWRNWVSNRGTLGPYRLQLYLVRILFFDVGVFVDRL